MRIAVFAKHHSPDIKDFVEDFLDRMDDYWEGLDVFLNPTKGLYEIIIVFGGDGTVLHAANFIHEHSIIFGFSMGTLGFLTPWDAKDAAKVIKDYFFSDDFQKNKDYTIQTSKSIRGYLAADPECSTRQQLPKAINEYTVRHKYPNKMLHLKCTIGDKTATEYHADALIISTALGSTAYSLAAGGSILEPELACWSLVPVAPHSLTHRPLIISCKNKITLEIGPDISIIIDGKEWVPPMVLGEVVYLELYDAQCNVRMIQPKDFNLYTVLNDKFRWGQRG